MSSDKEISRNHSIFLRKSDPPTTTPPWQCSCEVNGETTSTSSPRKRRGNEEDARSLLSATFLVLVGFAASASAAPIVGRFNIAGGAILTPVDTANPSGGDGCAGGACTSYTLDFVRRSTGGPLGTASLGLDVPSSIGQFPAIFQPTRRPSLRLSSVSSRIRRTTRNSLPPAHDSDGRGLKYTKFLSTFTAIPGIHFDLTQVDASSVPNLHGWAQAAESGCRPFRQTHPSRSRAPRRRRTPATRFTGSFEEGAD